MLDYILGRLKREICVDEVWLCTSKESEDDILEDVAIKNKVNLYRGSSDAVIERMISVGYKAKADYLIRVTGDNVFTSVEYLKHQIQFIETDNLDYVRLIDVPLGASAEVMTFSALRRCYELMDPKVSEYMMLFLFEPNTFNCGVIKPFKENYSDFSLTVDTKEDLIRTRALFKNLSQFDQYDIELKSLIAELETHKIRGSRILLKGKIKMPYEKEITIKEFKNDMNRRVNESKIKNLF